ncbi:hypothetical protein KSP40_PGU011494 [Platanthera guangdongensis]|uniref:Uncharacterized protein n=1 Tax=Platanthera guangdongensis TaxID=2320717 RepID=A0ABR2MGF1_9ASPA
MLSGFLKTPTRDGGSLPIKGVILLLLLLLSAIIFLIVATSFALLGWRDQWYLLRPCNGLSIKNTASIDRALSWSYIKKTHRRSLQIYGLFGGKKDKGEGADDAPSKEETKDKISKQERISEVVDVESLRVGSASQNWNSGIGI